jgi:hypothetical protein
MPRLIWRAPLATALVALGLLSLTSPGLSASGTALGVDPAAELQSGAASKTLVVGDDVQIGDRVVTGPAGQVQIKFTDQTELVVGPNSSLLIEDYLLREDDSPGKFAINALSGTFRFTTGRAPKDRYIITTPSGTIGVRGTSFDFNVAPVETRVLLYHGAAILCNLANVCVTLDDTCEVGAYDLGRSLVLGHTDDFKGKDREDLKADFAYAVSQWPLMGQFRVEQSKECFHKGFVRPVIMENDVTSDGTSPPVSGGDGPPPPNDPPPPDDDPPDDVPYDPYPYDDFGPECYGPGPEYEFLCN